MSGTLKKRAIPAKARRRMDEDDQDTYDIIEPFYTGVDVRPHFASIFKEVRNLEILTFDLDGWDGDSWLPAAMRGYDKNGVQILDEDDLEEYEDYLLNSGAGYVIHDALGASGDRFLLTRETVEASLRELASMPDFDEAHALEFARFSKENRPDEFNKLWREYCRKHGLTKGDGK